VLALSFTREYAPVVLIAAAFLVLAFRNRRAIRLTLIGFGATIPSVIVGGASIREALAFTFAGNRIPEDSSWGSVADQYLPQVEEAIRSNFDYILAAEPRFLEQALPLFPLTLPILAGIVMLLVIRSGSATDVFVSLMRGTLLGGLAFLLLLPHFTYLRYELVFLLPAAAGIAVAVDLARNWAGRSAGPGPAPS
jgi:hypothetical protein